MATHASNFAWRIPWQEEPGRLQPIVVQRVGHNLSELGLIHEHHNSKGRLTACWALFELFYIQVILTANDIAIFLGQSWSHTVILTWFR